jgi:hypothetical protein
MNATDPRDRRLPGDPGHGGDTAPAALSPDEARQGEVVFAKPWKRQVFFAVVAAAAVLGLVLIVALT